MRPDATATLLAIWREVLERDDVGVDDNFFDLGGHSLRMVEAAAKATAAGVPVRLPDFMRLQTIAALVDAATDQAPDEAEQGLVTGPVPLLPRQLVWLEWMQSVGADLSRQGLVPLLFEVDAGVEVAVIDQALRELARQHDAFRIAVRAGADGFEQENRGVEAIPKPAHLQADAADASFEQLVGDAVEELRRRMDISRCGFQAAILDAGAGRSRHVLWLGHTLVRDAVSDTFVGEDLQTLCDQLARVEPPSLPAKTASFRRFAEDVHGYARSAQLRDELPFWLAQRREHPFRLPTDGDGPNTLPLSSVVGSLDAGATRRLLAVAPGKTGATFGDILLAAVLWTTADWCGEPSLVIRVERHGRDSAVVEADVTRTVGWFSISFDVLLRLPDGGDLADAARAVHERLLSVPNGGIGFGVLKQLAPRDLADAVAALPPPDIRYDHVGGATWELPLADGRVVAPRDVPAEAFRRLSAYAEDAPPAPRVPLIDVRSKIVGGELVFSWVYSENLHERATIEALVASFKRNLQAFADI